MSTLADFTELQKLQIRMKDPKSNKYVWALRVLSLSISISLATSSPPLLLPSSIGVSSATDDRVKRVTDDARGYKCDACAYEDKVAS